MPNRTVVRRLLPIALLALCTAGLTAKAFASADCTAGSVIPSNQVCPDGSTQQTMCVCNSWDATSGYSDCYIYIVPC